jgi:hypothetical protein
MDAGSPSKLIFAQRIAVALAYIGLVNQDRVVVSIIGAPGRKAVQQLTPVRGRRGLNRAADFILENVWAPEGHTERGAAVGGGEGGGGTGFNAAIRTLAMSRRGKGVMVLLSDFLVREDYRDGLNFLAGSGGYDVHVMQVLSPGELEPEKESGGIIGDLRLTDAETGAAAEVTVSGALLKRYKQRLVGHIEGVRKACAARDMSHVMLKSDTDVAGLLLGYLRKRGVLG